MSRRSAAAARIIVGGTVAAMVALMAPSVGAQPQASSLPPAQPRGVGAAAASSLTPVVSSLVLDWAGAEPLDGTRRGTLFADGSVRSTAAPQVRIPLDPATRELVLGEHPRLTGSGWLDTVAVLRTNDDDVVGAAVPDATDPSTALLWRLDPATGRLDSRRVDGLAAHERFLGATADAWVTAAAATGPITLHPFDGSPAVDHAPLGLRTAVRAGGAGVLYTTGSPSATAGLDQVDLRLASADWQTVTVVADLGLVAQGSEAVGAADVSSTSVAWCGAGGIVQFWQRDLGEAAGWQLAAGDTCWDVAALDRGAAAFGWRYAGPMGTRASWSATWWVAPCEDDPLQVCGTGRRLRDPDADLLANVWPSMTVDGHAGVAGRMWGDTDRYRQQRWDTWELPDLILRSSIRPSVPLPAPMIALAATVGHVLAVHVRSNETEAGTHLTDTLLVSRRITGQATTAGFSGVGTWYPSRAARDGFDSPRQHGQLLSASGPYSAVFEGVDARRQRLVLRRGSTVTARLDPSLPEDAVPYDGSLLVSSGPLTYTATYEWTGTDNPAAPGYVLHLSWRGPDGRRHGAPPPATDMVTYTADGTRVAFIDRSGSAWLLDVLLPRSASNPRRVATGVAITTSAGQAPSLLLSGRFLVIGRTVLDVTTHRRRALTGNYRCEAVTGPLLLCQDLAGAVYTLDLSRSGSYYRRVPGLSAEWTLAAGPAIVTPLVDQANPRVYQARVTRIPAANGSVGRPRLLGPWAPSGRVASTAFCWKPEWTVSQALSRWKVALRSPSGRVVRTWTGTAADGGLGGVRWCPGRAAPGTYRWTLTGTGPTGGPVAAIGSGPATGTITVVRPVATRATATAPRSVARGATAVITGRLIRSTSGTALSGRSLALWQRTGEGTWHRVSSGTTSSRGTVVFRVALTATSRFQIRHAADPATRADRSPVRLIRVR